MYFLFSDGGLSSKNVLNQTWAMAVTMVSLRLVGARFCRSMVMLTSPLGIMIGFAGLKMTACPLGSPGSAKRKLPGRLEVDLDWADSSLVPGV